MFKRKIFALCGVLTSVVVFSQNTTVEEALQAIQQNNIELRALKERNKASRFIIQQNSALPAPEFGSYFLSNSKNNGPDSYREFEVTQSFQFPSNYLLQSKLNQSMFNGLELALATERQAILLEAKQGLLAWIALNKIEGLQQERQEQARKVMEQNQRLFSQSLISGLELNRAKLVWLQKQFDLQKTQKEKVNLEQEIKSLNGGLSLNLSRLTYPEFDDAQNAEEIWKEKQAADPEILLMHQQEEIALKALKQARSAYLPQIQLGYNEQGTNAQDRFAGLAAGLSIPIWSNGKRVQAAKAQLSYSSELNQSQALESKNKFDQTFRDFGLAFERFQEYKASLEELSGEEMLFKAYEAGEISYLEYYMELGFYQEAIDAMLEAEKELHLHQAELLKHQL